MGTEIEKDESAYEEKKENTQETSDITNGTQKYLYQIFNEFDINYKTKNLYSNRIISGFEKLDSLLHGFWEGDINIIASRPSIGKTTLALAMFTYIITQGINALYISFDKYENELLKIILSIKTNIDTMRFDNGFIARTERERMFDEATRLNDKSSCIFLKTFFKTDLIKLKEFIKEKIEKDKIKIVFIDYLTMIVPAPTYANRWEQVSEISRSLKSMAMEFGISFIVLCPINRNAVDTAPEITDLSESGSIEYEADRVLLLYEKPKKKIDFNNTENQNIISVYVAKNRRGPKAVIDLLFDYKNKKISDIKYDD